VYCAGDGSQRTVSPGQGDNDVLRNFKRVGACGATTGTNSAKGCVGAKS
jgi:hypothetical protein